MPKLSPRYEELEVALMWRLTPGEFDARPKLEQAEMLAMWRARRAVDNFTNGEDVRHSPKPGH